MYAAPELPDDPPYSAKIDVFAFRLILYEILVGSPVFPVTCTPYMIMKRVCEGIMAELPAGIHEIVKRLINRCWSVKPELRPGFSEILARLTQIRFRILPGVDPGPVEAFLSEVRKEVEQNA
jgi:hypothetical protein